MSDKYYMFSQGSYSDYSVGALCKSKEDLSSEYMAKYLKRKWIEKYPDCDEFVNQFSDTIEAVSSWGVEDKFYEFVTKDIDPSDDNNYNPRCEKSSQLYDQWWKRKDAFIRSSGFSKDYVRMAEEDGILDVIEYEEIWSE